MIVTRIINKSKGRAIERPKNTKEAKENKRESGGQNKTISEKY